MVRESLNPLHETNNLTREGNNARHLQQGPTILRPLSQGYLEVTSGNTFDHPIIEPKCVVSIRFPLVDDGKLIIFIHAAIFRTARTSITSSAASGHPSRSLRHHLLPNTSS